jgi:hypothetical protein
LDEKVDFGFLSNIKKRKTIRKKKSVSFVLINKIFLLMIIKGKQKKIRFNSGGGWIIPNSASSSF